MAQFVCEDKKLNSDEIVPGPNTLALPDLHRVQLEVIKNLREIFCKENQRRAIICLPTGSGKTRVAVQFAIESVLCPEGPNRSILWIAQSDELCEQAVQTFDYVWRHKGAENTDLRIIRYWGRRSSPEPQESDFNQPVVMVTTNLTLYKRKERIQWFSSPGIVVIDECHHQGMTYRDIHRWIFLSEKSKTNEPMLIGLSATPFRAEGEEQSRQLRNLYHGNIFPVNQKEIYKSLLNEKILANSINAFLLIKVKPPEFPKNGDFLKTYAKYSAERTSYHDKLSRIRNQILDFSEKIEFINNLNFVNSGNCHFTIGGKNWLDALGGNAEKIDIDQELGAIISSMSTNPFIIKNDLELIGFFRDILLDIYKSHLDDIDIDSRTINIECITRFENKINEALSEEEYRNEEIINKIKEYITNDPSESILLFGNTTSHSREISDRLNNINIAACHIDKNTGYKKRREYIEDFKSRKIKVICNYNILSTGFDAPKVSTIIICRKIHSPVNFMQIVGRGLRGEEIGGTKECKIVTILDDFGFEDFENHPVIRYLHKSYYEFERYIETYVSSE